MEQRIPIVIGMSFGDEGKGTTVDYLCSLRPIDFVVRFSGGPQTAHNVITNDGRHHTFAQFGSGTFQGAGTIATEHMLINPFNMVGEAEHLIEVTGENPFVRTLIDENALWITPAHIEANHQREINRGINRHGSCGQGVGETRGFSLEHQNAALRMADMASPLIWKAKMQWVIEFYKEEIPGYSFTITEELERNYHDMFEDIFQYVIVPHSYIVETIQKTKNHLVFEGSQGVLLDEVHGFHPNTTWSDTTNSKALKILAEAGISKTETETIGVFRTYSTRHGDGPIPAEFDGQEWKDAYPEAHNGYGQWQGNFRGGAFDLELARYANKAIDGGIDYISLSHCDREPERIVLDYLKAIPKPQIREVDDSFSREYRQEISDFVRSVKEKDLIFSDKMTLEGLIAVLEKEIAPVAIKSYGAKTENKESIWKSPKPLLMR